MKGKLKKYFWISALILIIIMITGSIFYDRMDRVDLIAFIKLAQAEFNHYLLRVPPYIYFFAFIILPAFGFPLSVFYLTALTVLGKNSPALGLSLGLIAVAGNIAFCRWMANSFLQPILKRILSRRHVNIPEISRKSEWQIVLATRLSPLPFALQNYLLALSKSHWRYYLGLSWLVQSLIGSGVMILGNSIFNGGLTYAILGIFLILTVSLLFQWIQKKINPTREPPLDSTPS